MSKTFAILIFCETCPNAVSEGGECWHFHHACECDLCVYGFGTGPTYFLQNGTCVPDCNTPTCGELDACDEIEGVCLPIPDRVKCQNPAGWGYKPPRCGNCVEESETEHCGTCEAEHNQQDVVCKG